MTSWVPKLIPRKTFTGKRITQTLDAFNRPTRTEVTFTIKNAGIQPLKSNERQVLPEGYRDRKAYRIFTTAAMNTNIEGTLKEGDIVVINNSNFVVMNSDDWSYGIQSHFEALLVEDNER